MLIRNLTAVSSGLCLALLAATATAETMNDPSTAEPGEPLASAPAPGPGPEQADVGTTEAPEEKANQDRPAPNSIYVEGLGAGLAYSFNYERRVVDDLGVRLGFSYLSMGASATTSQGTSEASATFMTFPLTASYLGIRSGKHALELGGGATLAYASASGSSLGASASGSGVGMYGDALVGYRLHPVGGAGFQFRIGLMALVGKGLSLSEEDPDAVGVLPWGYLSMGASF